MSKSYIFINTHYGSGGSVLCRILNTNKNIACIGSTNIYYKTALDTHVLDQAINLYCNHKSCAYIYVDKLVQNCQWGSKLLYDKFKFIYLIRNPISVKNMITNRGFNQKFAYNYYCFRLRRLYEMSCLTKNHIFLTYDQLSDSLEKISNFVDAKIPLTPKYDCFQSDKDDINLMSGKIIKDTIETDVELYKEEELNNVYEKYLKKMQPNFS